MLTLTTFRWVPPFARGLVRDMRVRWALEEAGLPYRTSLIDFETAKRPVHRGRQPFGQVPVLEDDGLVLFESGAIALHIAARSAALMPADEAGQARATAWVLAALNSVEIALQPLVEIDLFHADEEWAKLRRDEAERRARRRLGQLAAWLGPRDYLEDRFTVGDLMMTTVLQIPRGTGLVEAEPRLEAYRERCTARPAYRRALRDHMAVFAAEEGVG